MNLRLAHIARILRVFTLPLVVSSIFLASCSLVPSRLKEVSGLSRLGSSPAEISVSLEIIHANPDSEGGKEEGCRLLRLWNQNGQAADSRLGDWQLVVSGDYPQGYFDSLVPAEDFEIVGFKDRHTRPGKGIPLVGHRQNRHREEVENYYPPEGICRPVTAVFQPGPGKTLHLTLADPTQRDYLATDFTAPLSSLLGGPSALGRKGFTGLLRGNSLHEDEHRLYLLEPYDPQKTPVLFVHGLLSTPLIWAQITNDAWGDPAFRRRYQVWHYLYPTSAPFLYSALLFRQRIDEARHFFDPNGDDPASRNLDIVAHSMGGLLTRTLITDSGNRIWNDVFQVPPEQLTASPADHRQVYDILHWKARRDVRRVIFIAVPHRGSTMSRGWIGRLGDSLAGLPVKFTSLYARIHHDNPGALRPGFNDALSKGKLTSIDTLSPAHPLLKTLLELPVSRRVEIHSIVGNRGRTGPLAQSSDGVVPYTSSHLDQALSELVVPAGHSATQHPDTVHEVLRIMDKP